MDKPLNNEFMSVALPRITVQQAAELSGRAAQYIRIAMQRNLIDIGVAMKMPGSTRYYYDIRPQKLANYLGIDVSSMYASLGIRVDCKLSDESMSEMHFYYYNGEEGYELECEQDEYKDHAE